MKFQFNLLAVICLAALSIFSLSSCGDIQQDLIINKDGSGSLETTLDIGELMNMANGLEDMGSDMDTFSDDMIVPDTAIAEPAAPKDAMTLLMEKITDPNYARDFDTTMSFLSIMPDSVKEKEKRLDLVDKMFVKLKSPANSGDLSFGIFMKFDNTNQLQELIDYMESFNQNSNLMSGASPVSMDSETFLSFDSDMKAGWIRVDTVLYTGFAEQMGMPQDSAMSSEDMGMMEMMFGNSKIKSVIHIPGEVISCTNKDAILTKDNKVLIEYPMMDVIRKGKIDGYTIYFKP
ncbi:MAG TPA: hypothetical protein VMZ69_04220 [Saprospiraceae bacterium]|nr:hypothetical protein [Saprospiraceae bacterium]